MALRVRPFNEREIKENNHNSLITFVPLQPQIILDRRQPFTFDYVFDPNISQSDVYQTSIQPLFDQFTKG